MTELIISFVFRFLNFAALIAIVIYILRKYAIHDLQLAAQQDADMQKNMSISLERLHEDSLLTYERTKQMEQEATRLKDAMNIWQAAITAAANANVLEAQHAQQAAIERVAQQTNNLHKKLLLKKTLPDAIMHAKEKLANFYAEPANQARYTADILTQLKRENHGKH